MGEGEESIEYPEVMPRNPLDQAIWSILFLTRLCPVLELGVS